MHIASAEQQKRRTAAFVQIGRGDHAEPSHGRERHSRQFRPHARHTTTNLRNAARILFRDSLPLDKPVWIVSDIYQGRYIESQGFADRCSRELGYRPFRKLTRLSPNDLEWVPDYLASLVQDPRDPLDP